MDNNTAEKCYEYVISGLSDMILNGELQVGDKLPPERKLAEHFHVSRVPIREATKILEYTGVLECVQGFGTFVKALPINTTPTSMDHPTKEEVLDFLNIRIEMEGYAAALAAICRTEMDIQKMHDALDFIAKMGQRGEQDDQVLLAVHEHSKMFHQLIISATHSTSMIRLYASMKDILDVSVRYTMNGTSSFSALQEHKHILDYIIQRNSAAAQQAMSVHLLRIRDAFNE